MGAVATTPEPLVPSVGWNVVHLFFKSRPGTDAAVVGQALADAGDAGCQTVLAAIVGHKADLCVMATAEDLWDLRRLQTGLEASGLEIVESYVSMTEVSEYAQGTPERIIEARLHPNIPPEGMRAFCFYPMSKRRGEEHNWYALPYDQRRELMMEHGKSGREFHGRILQVVTGSTGLDDWEWGVTLFGVHPDDVKECVYTMRFDEASTLYAEFGPFYTGMVGTLDEVLGSVNR
jgi:chlorite dismutase